MIDLSINTSPISPFGLAGISPLAFQPSSTEVSTAPAPGAAPASSIIALSGEGQLLSALAVFQDRLGLLQTASADASPAAVLDTAAGLVNAFNDLQASTSNLQPLFDALSGGSAADRLTLALNELATSVTATDSASPASLPEIGIVLQLPSAADNAASAAGASITLRIEAEVLNAALAADPTTARTLLAQTGRAFLEQASVFATEAANAALAPISLPPPSVSLTVDQTEEGALVAVAAVDAAPAVPVDTVVNTALQQLTVDNALNELLLTDIDFSTATATETADQVGTVTPAPTSLVTEEVPGATLAAPPATPVATPLATPALVTSGALAAANAADSEAFAATLALRDLLADPTRHAANNLLDPAYAALIAASRLRDFLPADQEGNPQAAAADFPAPVSGLARARALASYLDARNNELRQQERAVA